MVALSDFPSFTSERQLFKALRSQGFSVDRRGPGYRVTAPDGVFITRPERFVFIHSGSITDRSGNRSRNILKELVSIGFLPPAEFERNKKRLALSAKHIAEVKGEEVIDVPTEAPADTEPKTLAEAKAYIDSVQGNDPKRKFACELCVIERCRVCVKKELPCAFPLPLNLGRHRTAIHGAASQPHSRPRSGKVRTRVDPDVIPNVVGRRIVQLRRLQSDLAAILESLVGEVETLRIENQELRRFRTDVERQANALYDATTKPRS